ncbi:MULTISPECIES: phage tail tape measure protein [unclassified Sphingomonas]|uniref:phage tail tape measure protein n=1 Tax=Novosphingobium rhizosphaerae TaxID=1551649 RepID=UPI0015CE764F
MSNKLSLLINFIGVDKMSGALRNIVGLSRQGSTSIKALTGEQRRLEQQLKATRRQIEQGNGNLTEAINRERELERAIEGVNNQLQRQRRVAAINAEVAGMTRRSQELRSRGQDNMLGGVAMAAPFVLAGKAAMDFSSGMVDIQQKAQLTNAETDRMAASIMQLARASHQLPEDMRAGIDVLAAKGMDPRQAIQMIGPIGRLGTAFKVELADGSAAAFANLNNLKVPLADTAKALDMMAAGANVGSFEVADMARNFPALTARLQALGDTGTPAVADLTAALEIAMNTAGNADEAANNIGNLLSKINSPTVIAAFQKKFGVDLPAAMKKFQAQGMTTMEAFATVTQRATGGDTKKLGWVVEDMQAQMGLLALIQNMDKYRQMRGQIQNQSAGTVDGAFGQREARDASVQWKDFTGQLQRLAIVVGTKLLPQFMPFLGAITNAMDAVGQWAQANPQLASSLASLLAGAVAARIGIGALQFAFGNVLGPVAQLWGWFARAQALGTMATMLPRLAAGFTLLTGPIGLTVIAIAGVAYAVYRYWGPISGYFQRNWTTIRNLFLGAMVIFTPWLAAIVYAASLVYRHWDGIKAATMTMVRTVAGIVAPFIQPWITIGTFLAGIAGKFVGYGVDIVGGLIRGIASMTGSVIKAFLDLAGAVGARFAAALGIKSPSRVFMAMGGHITDGLRLGIDGGRGGAAQAARRMAIDVASAGALSLSPSIATATPRLAPAAAIRPAARAANPMPTAAAPIVIHVHAAPGMDVKDLARQVRRELEAAQGVSTRSRYDTDGR